MGYFDGREARTGETAPTIIYLVYAFLGLVTAWQFISFLVGLRLKRKFNKRDEGGNKPDELTADRPPLKLADVRRSPVERSITEDSTRRLDKVRR